MSTKKPGRPPIMWRDWEGRRGTVVDMCLWHQASRAALYKRQIRLEDGSRLLLAPKKRRRGKIAR